MIKIHWNPKNKDWFIKKGYVFTKYNDILSVKAEELQPTSSIKVNVICDYCGVQYETTYTSYCKGFARNNKSACKHCMGLKSSELSLRKRQETIYKKLVDICQNKDYILITKLDDIRGTHDAVDFICAKHGAQHTTISSFMQYKNCYDCSRETASENKNKTTLKNRQNSLYKKAVESCSRKGYTLLTQQKDIINNSTFVTYKCPVHGEHTMKISNLINNKGCPDCANELLNQRFKMTEQDVIDNIAMYDGTILNANEYINNTTKNLKIVCSECGEVFITSLRNYTQHGGQVCDVCSGKESNGERKIKQYLINNNIDYIQEKRFDDCRDIKPLPFDFFIPSYNTIIEFDGRQHFEETNIFTYSLDKVQKHDKIKNQYCKSHGIYLIRICYKDIGNISEILNNKLILHEDIV